ncbi:alpha/beta hydrolase [Chloroflexota bacterium]
MKKQAVSFKSDGLNLYGELFSPDSSGLSSSAFIICHGIPAVPHNPAEHGYELLAEYFCTSGFTTFVFNFRGAGLSEGNIDMPGWTRDLKAAIDFLYSNDGAKREGIALMGSSGGAAVSVCVAADDPRITSVVTLACPATFEFLSNNQAKELIAHFRKIGVIRDPDFPKSIEDWFEGFGSISPINLIHQISPRPLLLIHGDKDDTVSIDHAHKLYEKAKEPKELRIITGAGHRLRHNEKAVEITMNWLKKIYS